MFQRDYLYVIAVLEMFVPVCVLAYVCECIIVCMCDHVFIFVRDMYVCCLRLCLCTWVNGAVCLYVCLYVRM